jgi:hypothetical protein
MRKGIGIILVFILAVPLLAQQPLAINRVLLYKNGMAYIVRGGQITTPMSLTFHPEDMNDAQVVHRGIQTTEAYSVGYTAGFVTRFPLS